MIIDSLCSDGHQRFLAILQAKLAGLQKVAEHQEKHLAEVNYLAGQKKEVCG
jgi:hypothetical protein